MGKVRGFEKLMGGAVLPHRATPFSAGYDFHAYLSRGSIVIDPGQIVPIPTGITAYMLEDEVLLLFIRSGHARKRSLTLQNAVGVVDSDYYGQEIVFLVRNESSSPVRIMHQDRIGQGIFTKYLLADNDQPPKVKRTGGFGSTGGWS